VSERSEVNERKPLRRMEIRDWPLEVEVASKNGVRKLS